jgi:hypothetical protein
MFNAPNAWQSLIRDRATQIRVILLPQQRWLTVSRLRLLSVRGHMVDGYALAVYPVLTSDIGESLATSEQIVAIAQVIWPAAKTIEVTPYKAGRSSWSSSEVAEGFKLTISAEGGSLVALIIAGTLDALKAKLDQRSRKKRWGSF